jgi:hypothetical protein
VVGGGRPAEEEEPAAGLENGREELVGLDRRKENGRKKKVGGAHKGKRVISLVGLTPLAQNMDGMPNTSTNLKCMAHRYLRTFSRHAGNLQLS